MTKFTESIVEDAALGWLQALGYEIKHGPDIAVGEPGVERSDPNYRDLISFEAPMKRFLKRNSLFLLLLGG